MVYGKIAKEQFNYNGDMSYIYFLNDGYVYAAFNASLPSGWASLTEVVFTQYTREMYADTLTWGVGKPLIQIANTTRYGLVVLADRVDDDNPAKVATAHAVKLAYDIAVAAYDARNATGLVGVAVFNSLAIAKDSTLVTVFNSDGSITERISPNATLAEKSTTFSKNGDITETTKFYNIETGEVKEQYTTTTVFNKDGSIMTATK
jgi:hypothetical protein